MDDKLFIGLALGFMVGAIMAHNNQKVGQIIEQGKEKVKETIDKI